MHHCLNKSELKQLIKLKVENKDVEDELLRALIDNSQNWFNGIGALTYLFSQVLLNEAKDGENCSALIGKLYELQDEMSFYVHEFDAAFVMYMLKNVRNSTLSLEEELIELQSNMSEYNYEGTLRY